MKEKAKEDARRACEKVFEEDDCEFAFCVRVDHH
jgi:hypothetical protein